MSMVLCNLQARAKARAAGQEFMDRTVLQGRFPMQLPPALLPRGQLSPPQQLVYEDFARIPRTAPGTAALPFPLALAFHICSAAGVA